MKQNGHLQVYTIMKTNARWWMLNKQSSLPGLKKIMLSEMIREHLQIESFTLNAIMTLRGFGV